jgi:anti-sigma regulatory factor (Ser/Thr protein kinase)
VRLIVSLLTIAIRREHDILLLRQRGRQIGQFLGFSTVDIVRITTALSEMARNAFEYGGGGSSRRRLRIARSS